MSASTSFAPSTTHTVQFVDADGDKVFAEFTSGADAWAFMRLCDAHGVSAGFPQWV